MREIEESILEGLGSIAFYNGHDEEIKQVIEYLKSYDKSNSTIFMPEFLRSNDCDYFINILWQLSVLLYGDYGTSPRYGWLESENLEKILDMWEYLYDISMPTYE